MAHNEAAASEDSKALVAGVVGAAVATATDMAVHATPLSRAAAVLAAVAGGAAAYVIEHGGTPDALHDGPADTRGPQIHTSDTFAPLIELDATSGEPGFVDGYTAGGAELPVIDEVGRVVEHVTDVLGWNRSHCVIIDPIEPGTPTTEAKDFID